MKDRISGELSYVKSGYPTERWKWVLALLHEKSLTEESFTREYVSDDCIKRTYGLDKYPKLLPCVKKCQHSPWCLADIGALRDHVKKSPTDQPRTHDPIGLQNTAQTCWINSAVQALYHIPLFRNVINSLPGFEGDSSLSSVAYLLQALFVEMDMHPNRALACTSGSIFDKLGLFATQTIMRKDADHEVLKCVSEFLDNTIDMLMAEPKIGPQISSVFSISLARLGRWKCTACGLDHESLLSPSATYNMAAYVSADECPLDQCILELQTETQTGVSLICGEMYGGGGCGREVKVDRVVTPRIEKLPFLLIIRNNSLLDKSLKKRHHVVYPEVLDLTSFTLRHTVATYSLVAVVFHHGSWAKHFSAQVANKYKLRSDVRVSRGAFIWIYVRNEIPGTIMDIPPPEPVFQFVKKKHTENEFQDFISHRCGIRIDESVKVPLAYTYDDSLCRDCIVKYARHIIFIEKLKNLHKQAKKEARMELESPTRCIGEVTLECWPRLALITYIKENNLEEDLSSDFNDRIKSESLVGSETPQTPDTIESTDDKSEQESLNEAKVSHSLDNKGNDINTRNSKKELHYFNEDIVCQHNFQSPTAKTYFLDEKLYNEIAKLCRESIHPAVIMDDFISCGDCGAKLMESVKASQDGLSQKKQLHHLFTERKRALPLKDMGKIVYVMAREFMIEWKSYIRSCEKNELDIVPPSSIANDSLLCIHGKFIHSTSGVEHHELLELLLLVWPDEWEELLKFYKCEQVITASFSDSGQLITQPELCDQGCVEAKAAEKFEDQFTYESALIYIRQVNSSDDIPRRIRHSSGVQSETAQTRKKPRLMMMDADDGNDILEGGTSMGTHRLVRASKTFSSSDTLKEVQNFIAERTKIWPMLQTIWLISNESGELVQVSEEHRSMTLNALRIRPDDTIYFRASVSESEWKSKSAAEIMEYLSSLGIGHLNKKLNFPPLNANTEDSLNTFSSKSSELDLHLDVNFNSYLNKECTNVHPEGELASTQIRNEGNSYVLDNDRENPNSSSLFELSCKSGSSVLDKWSNICGIGSSMNIIFGEGTGNNLLTFNVCRREACPSCEGHFSDCLFYKKVSIIDKGLLVKETRATYMNSSNEACFLFGQNSSKFLSTYFKKVCFSKYISRNNSFSSSALTGNNTKNSVAVISNKITENNVLDDLNICQKFNTSVINTKKCFVSLTDVLQPVVSVKRLLFKKTELESLCKKYSLYIRFDYNHLPNVNKHSNSLNLKKSIIPSTNDSCVWSDVNLNFKKNVCISTHLKKCMVLLEDLVKTDPVKKSYETFSNAKSKSDELLNVAHIYANKVLPVSFNDTSIRRLSNYGLRDRNLLKPLSDWHKCRCFVCKDEDFTKKLNFTSSKYCSKNSSTNKKPKNCVKGFDIFQPVVKVKRLSRKELKCYCKNYSLFNKSFLSKKRKAVSCLLDDLGKRQNSSYCASNCSCLCSKYFTANSGISSKVKKNMKWKNRTDMLQPIVELKRLSWKELKCYGISYSSFDCAFTYKKRNTVVNLTESLDTRINSSHFLRKCSLLSVKYINSIFATSAKIKCIASSDVLQPVIKVKRLSRRELVPYKRSYSSVNVFQNKKCQGRG